MVLEGLGLAVVGTFIVIMFLSGIASILSTSTAPRDPRVGRVSGLVTLVLTTATAYFVFQ